MEPMEQTASLNRALTDLLKNNSPTVISHKIELNVSESTLEQLHCSVCKGYLSHPPLRALPDGSTMCGRCSPPDEDAPTYLQLALEAIMRDATFPCKFSRNGCEMRLPFGDTSTHEDECAHRNGPESPKPGCSTTVPESPTPGGSTSAPEQGAVGKSTIVLHNTQLTLKIDDGDKTSAAGDSAVLNPFNGRKRKASVVSVQSWNGNVDSPRGIPTRTNSWNGGFNNNYAERNANNHYYSRDWRHTSPYTPPYRPGPHYNAFERNSYRNKRRNDLVVIKGHTIYITL